MHGLAHSIDPPDRLQVVLRPRQGFPGGIGGGRALGTRYDSVETQVPRYARDLAASESDLGARSTTVPSTTSARRGRQGNPMPPEAAPLSTSSDFCPVPNAPAPDSTHSRPNSSSAGACPQLQDITIMVSIRLGVEVTREFPAPLKRLPVGNPRP